MSRFHVAYICRELLESNYAKFRPDRSKGLGVDKEHADRRLILRI